MKRTWFSLVTAITLLLVTLSGSDAFAQKTDWTVVKTPHDTIKSLALLSCSDSLLFVERQGVVIPIALDSLTALIQGGDTHFWLGAGIGALVGGVAGAIIASNSVEEPSNVVGRVVVDVWGRPATAVAGLGIGLGAGFLVGGLIGSVTGTDDVRELSGLNRKAKSAVVSELIESNRPTLR